MGAEYLFYVKSTATFAPTFYGSIISVLARVFFDLQILEMVELKLEYRRYKNFDSISFWQKQTPMCYFVSKPMQPSVSSVVEF